MKGEKWPFGRKILKNSSCSNLLGKILLVRYALQIHRFNGFRLGEIAPKGQKITDGGVSPRYWIPNIHGSPVRAKDLSCLQHSFVGALFNGGLHPRLWSDQPFRLRLGRTEFYPKGRSNKDFLGFSVERFSRGLNECHKVVLSG